MALTEVNSKGIKDADIATGAAQVEQGLVQREPVIGVDPAPHVLDPGGVVDMAFEDRASLDDILEIDAVGIAVGMGFDVADPLAVALAVAAAAEPHSPQEGPSAPPV